MLISVIIPVYNVQPYLKQCIESIINQTYKNLEIILVDDGSTDESGSICDSYALQDKRIRVIHQENMGLSSARNTGIDSANGDFISFIDSDDYVDPDLYQILHDKVVEYNLDIISFRSSINKGGKLYTPKRYKGEFTIYQGKEILENALKNDDVCVWNKLYKRSVIGNIRFPVGRVFEDTATNYLFMNHAYRYAHYNKALHIYRKRAGSICADGLNYKKRYDFFLAYKEQLNFSKQHGNIAKDEIITYSVKAALSCLTAIYALPKTADSKIMQDELEAWVIKYRPLAIKDKFNWKYKLFMNGCGGSNCFHKVSAKLSYLAKSI